jgi:hypothetical protein
MHQVPVLEKKDVASSGVGLREPLPTDFVALPGQLVIDDDPVLTKENL